MWPFHRRHSTYKVTVDQGIPLRNEKGKVIPIANRIIRQWAVYDSATWNALANMPARKARYIDYETIADNEYVVIVETRYRLFHNVENTLRICTSTLG
jgi:hypothetical protein